MQKKKTLHGCSPLFEDCLQGKVSVYLLRQAKNRSRKNKTKRPKKEKISSDGVEPRTIFNRGHYVVNWATTPYQVLNVPLKLTSLTFFAHEFCP